MKKALVLAGLCLFLQPVCYSFDNAHASNYVSVLKKVYLLQISFISKGAGIDTEAFDKIEALLKEHPKKPSYTVNAFGKEGEKNIFVELANLSKKEQKALENDISKLIVKKDLVVVKKLKKIRAKY